ncbi:hypothetical protein [Dechloromonas sp. ZS-1]|uniref:hypothetical protein n=1 Tax=Dechloromonas sp. ZS-1 TaxID=3138067 RepID=UPI0031FE3DF4
MGMSLATPRGKLIATNHDNARRMDTEDLKQDARLKREREYHSFLGLFREYRDVLNPPLPAEGSEFASIAINPEWSHRIEKLHREVYASPYFRRFDRPALSTAFKALETLLAATPGIPVSLDELGRKRRELCFMHRFAQIVKWQDYERSPPDQEALGKARKRVSRVCQELEELLLDQLEDQHLLRKLHKDDLATLPGLIKDLGRLGEVFETIKPDLPYDRNRNPANSVIRLVLDDVAECCYRIYEACDYEVVRQLLRSCWLHPYAGIRKGELEEMISNALERKQSDYRERNIALDDDRAPPEISWTPVRSL